MSEPSRRWTAATSSGVKRSSVPVVDRAERDAVVVGRDDRVAEREDLEAARVGEDRAVPAHEPVQAAELLDELVARPEAQVVRVGEDDRRAELPDSIRVEALDRRLRPDRHERGRGHVAVGGGQDARAGFAVDRGDREGAHAGTFAQRSSIASPNE